MVLSGLRELSKVVSEWGGTLGYRSDKIYCCGTCKASANAKKKVVAHRLYRSGLKAKEIAQRIKYSLVTLNRWVADREN
jgi:hypothetical protein